MKYQTSPFASIVIAIILAVLFAAELSSASVMKKIEVSPYINVDVTSHGVGKHWKGISGSIGPGAEALYVVNNNFAYGVNAKTDILYDCYFDDDKRGTLVDEYGIWRGNIGIIVYMGEMFYLSYMAVIELSTFHDETYISAEEDIPVDKSPYKIEDINYSLEAGLRVDYHMATYISVNSQYVIPEGKKTRFQVKVGLKYHI